jgi:hypothetical protein
MGSKITQPEWLEILWFFLKKKLDDFFIKKIVGDIWLTQWNYVNFI